MTRRWTCCALHLGGKTEKCWYAIVVYRDWAPWFVELRDCFESPEPNVKLGFTWMWPMMLRIFTDPFLNHRLFKDWFKNCPWFLTYFKIVMTFHPEDTWLHVTCMIGTGDSNRHPLVIIVYPHVNHQRPVHSISQLLWSSLLLSTSVEILQMRRVAFFKTVSRPAWNISNDFTIRNFIYRICCHQKKHQQTISSHNLQLSMIFPWFSHVCFHWNFHSSDDFPIFPKCVARVPVSLWGFGVEAVFARSRATVRNRSREGRMVVPMASSAKAVTFGGSKRSVASFRPAGVALPDILTCLQTCRTSFCVAGALLWRHSQKLSCSFRGGRSTLETSIVILRGRHSAWACCVLFENRNVRAASSGNNVQIPWQACRFVTCDDTPRFTLYTPHFTLHTLQVALHTLHSTLYTFQSTLHTVHFALHTPHSTLYTLQFTLYILHSTLYTPHFTLHTLHFTFYTPHATLYTPHTTHYTLHFTLHTVHSTLYTSHFTLYSLHSTLHTL